MTTQYTGGYFLLNEPIVRGYAHHSHTSSDLSNLSNYTIDSLNAVQDTPWEINPFMRDVIQSLVDIGEDVEIKNDNETEVILRLNKPDDPRKDFYNLPKETWAGLTKEAKQQKNSIRARALELYEENLGVFRATRRILDSITEMDQFERFYFPHNLDFRLRMYPIPTDLTPQSNDLSKGALRFHRGTVLGKDGVFWLGFSVATHWGEDKLHSTERYKWACDNLDFVSGMVDDPLTNREWLHADKPFQFLAAAHEWVWANRSGAPEEFVAHIPVNLDGTCNGAQHLSIMARDKVGAEATNCRNFNERNDLYMKVADSVYEKVLKDARTGDELAVYWSSKLSAPSARRKVVKRSVMTVPYGVTEYGVADFMVKEHVSKREDRYWDKAKYMRDLVLASIDDTLANGRALQVWFQECAMICAEAGKPLQWDTPAGSKVTQAYRNLVEKRIRAFGTRFVIYQEPDPEEEAEDFLTRVGMDVKKSGTSAPPNVVHSCDASHLQITVCRMSDVGVRDFSMIHDSFGCPAAHVGKMRDILRQSVVDMYKDDYLKTFKESVERYSGLTMPEPPAVGDYDLNEILTSEYFFS